MSLYIRVKPDLEKAAKYGLKPGDIRRAAAAIVAGDEVAAICTSTTRCTTSSPGACPGARRDVQSIRDLPSTHPAAAMWPSPAANVNIRPTPNRISREDNSRRIDVGMNVRGRDLGSVAAEVRIG